MEITKPQYSTIVEPSEYPIEEQFDAMARDANKHKEGFASMDVGKVVGLLEDWQALTTRLQEAERLLELYRIAYNNSTAADDNLVDRMAAIDMEDEWYGAGDLFQIADEKAAAFLAAK